MLSNLQGLFMRITYLEGKGPFGMCCSLCFLFCPQPTFFISKTSVSSKIEERLPRKSVGGLLVNVPFS